MIDSLFAGDAPPLLVEQAHRLAAALGVPRGRIVLSCQYADAFVPGLLGAWLAGATVELLPNVQPATLDRVDADPEIDRVLHDGVAYQERSAKALYVPDVILQPTTARATGWPAIAAVMSTSGTTAQPRYVAKKMAQLVDEIDVLAATIQPARCVLATVPLSHLYGMLWGVLLPLRFGARIVNHAALLPGELAAVIEREGVDLMISTPAHLRAMANAAMPRGLRVISSGARMPPELHMSLATGHGWHVTEVLGSTETGGIATRTQPMQNFRPLPRVAVTAPDGRLVVESPWSGERRAVLDDLVELDDSGGFRHVGRSSELIKIAGKRAHAQALEAAIRTVPGIVDVAVTTQATTGKEPRVAVAIVTEPGVSLTRDAIIDVIRVQFDAVFVPRIIKTVASIPRTERGKLDSGELPALIGITPLARTSDIPFRRTGPASYVADIPHDLVFFTGHFDDFPILPGAVLVERVVWPIVKSELPAIRAMRGLRRLRFRRPVMPDQQLSITLEHTPGRVTFAVSCAGSPVASGQLLVE